MADICEAAATDGGDDWNTVTVMTMTVMTAGGFIFSEVVGYLQSYLYIIYILYIDRGFSGRWRVDK